MWFSDEQTSRCPTVVGEVPQLYRDHNPLRSVFCPHTPAHLREYELRLTPDLNLIVGPNVFVIVSLFTVIWGLARLLVRAVNFVFHTQTHTHSTFSVYISGRSAG